MRGTTNKNNCDIHTVSGNAKDSLITVEAINGNYRFKTTNYNLYLTAKGSSNGSDVRWEAWTGSTNQQWKAVNVDGGSTPLLRCPVDNPNISSPYGWRTLYGERKFHYGIDYKAAMSTLLKQQQMVKSSIYTIGREQNQD